MHTSTLDGIESIRIIRADGNLKVISGPDVQHATIEASTAPEIIRNAGAAEVIVRANATLAIPAGVAVEIEELGGNLDLSDLATPIVVKRVRGNLDARRIGSIAMREAVSGNVSIKGANSIEGYKVRGSLQFSSRTVHRADSRRASGSAGRRRRRSRCGRRQSSRVESVGRGKDR